MFAKLSVDYQGFCTAVLLLLAAQPAPAFEIVSRTARIDGLALHYLIGGGALRGASGSRSRVLTVCRSSDVERPADSSRRSVHTLWALPALPHAEGVSRHDYRNAPETGSLLRYHFATTLTEADVISGDDSKGCERKIRREITSRNVREG